MDDFNDSFMESDDNAFADMEAVEELGEDDFKDLVEEHEDEVKQAKKRSRIQINDDEDVTANDDKDGDGRTDRF